MIMLGLVLFAQATAQVVIMPTQRQEPKDEPAWQGTMTCAMQSDKAKPFTLEAKIDQDTVRGDWHKLVLTLSAPQGSQLSGTFYTQSLGDSVTLYNFTDLNGGRPDFKREALLRLDFQNGKGVVMGRAKASLDRSLPEERLIGFCDINFQSVKS